MTTTTDTVQHAGQTYSLADLAENMQYDHREAVHSSDVMPGTSQEFWNEFVRRFPVEAEEVARLTAARD